MNRQDADSRARLARGLSALGVAYTEAQGVLLLRYLDELERWNAAYNLTAVRDRPGMILRHLLDSAAILPPLEDALSRPGATVLDVGSGPGLPGLVLAILGPPDVPITVLDSNGKKARFLRHAVRTLGLSQVTVAEARVEAWRPPEPYTLITSRAFAALGSFFELTEPLLAPGGQWAAMKGKLTDQERSDCPARVHIREIIRLQIPGLHEDRHLVVAEAA